MSPHVYQLINTMCRFIVSISYPVTRGRGEGKEGSKTRPPKRRKKKAKKERKEERKEEKNAGLGNGSDQLSSSPRLRSAHSSSTRIGRLFVGAAWCWARVCAEWRCVDFELGPWACGKLGVRETVLVGTHCVVLTLLRNRGGRR